MNHPVITGSVNIKHSPHDSRPFSVSDLAAFLIFIPASFLVYRPVLNRFFVSDDFKVLYRVCIEQVIFIKRFFRPLSDISILMNFKLGGLNPIAFNSFNILIHGINAYLIYLTCLCFGHSPNFRRRNWFAIISSILFLCYPFHNEAIVWILGRGATMACLFSLLAIISYYKIKKNWQKMTAVCLFYFISMTAFESTIFLPVIFVLILISDHQKKRVMLKWFSLLCLTLVLQISVRIMISGSVLGSYGEDFFQAGWKAYLLNIAKVGGRLVFPPSDNTILISALFVLLISLALLFLLRNFQRIRLNPKGRNIFYLSGMLFISCIIPFITGISTRTSETDRILYFPSVFLCMITGYLLVFWIKNLKIRLILMAGILTYNLFFLEMNNMNWIKASGITHAMVEKIRSANLNGRMFFLNIPDEINGAYVFRQGFPFALRLYGMDSNRFIAVNYLPRQDLDKMKGKLVLHQERATFELPPDIIVKSDSNGCRQFYDHGILKFTARPGDLIYYWDIKQLENIQACSLRSPG